jgi:hypothetical protein
MPFLDIVPAVKRLRRELLNAGLIAAGIAAAGFGLKGFRAF